jgi:hypothetical protein
MRLHKSISRLILTIALAALIAGCAGTTTPQATPTATRTPAATATPSPVAPTATPTETPTPEPSLTPSPEVVAATPPPPDVNPLTGLKVDDPAELDKIPVAVKVSNSPETRPQSGLGAADLVFEHYTESAYSRTRFTGVFYGQNPAQVGSVRSGRLIDLEIPAMYHAIFGYSGSSAGVKERIRTSDLFPDRIAAPDFGVGQPVFYRVPQQGKAFEHTLFTSPERLRELAEDRGLNERPEYETYMAFSENVPPGGEPIENLAVQYSSGERFTAEWAYDEEQGTWLRSISGTPHRDALTGEQITASNVILVFANHVNDNFWEEMHGPQSNWLLSIQIQVWGEGSVLVFRDGQMIPGMWHRKERDHMLTFTHGDGIPLPLKPGNSWIQLVPIDTPSESAGDEAIVFNP